MSANTEARWCPSCRAEYRPGFTECAECHVALVDEPPPPVQRRRVRRDAALDHETVAYDISDWAPEQHRAFDMMLNGLDIARGFDDGMLVVPRVHRYEVECLIDTVDADDTRTADKAAGTIVVLTSQP